MRALRGAVWAWLVLAACLAMARPAAAYLRLHPDNPHYFQETTTGQAVLIASHGNVAPTSLGIDYAAEVARSAGYRMDYARVWHWLPWEGDRALWPWRRTAPGGPYDFRAWDPAYFRRLKDGIGRCRRAGIYAEIMLFEACGMKEGATRWARNPWASDNNVNGLELPPRDSHGIPAFYDFGSRPRLREQQERTLRKIVDETIGFPNVIYELENEHAGPGEPAWTQHYSTFAKEYIASRYPGSPRLLANSSDPETCFAAPAVDIVNFHSDSRDPGYYRRLLESNWKRGKAMNVDELANGETSYEALRKVCWTIVTSGGHFHIEDAAPSSRPYDIARNVRAFCARSRWDFVRAAPDSSLSGPAGGTCMARPGVEYVCYFAAGGSRSLDLPAGTYTARWWDPRAGGFRGETTFHHAGGRRAFRTPDRDDWVLQVRCATP